MKLDNILYYPTPSNIFTFLNYIPENGEYLWIDEIREIEHQIEKAHQHYFMCYYDENSLKEISPLLKRGYELMNDGYLDYDEEYLSAYIETCKKKIATCNI